MQKFKFNYDKENDDLFLFNPKSKSKGSVELGDIVFDYNNKKEFVGIQLMNASKLLKELTGEKIQIMKNLLVNLNDCRVNVKANGNILIVKLILVSKSKEIRPMITVPSIHETSPSLAYA